MKSNSRILIAGSNGCVGSAIVRKLQEKGHKVGIGSVANFEQK